ncbi:ribosomal RNA large subunit methyltransferase L [mine drainage metagenome]|uniref:Ribosomal RNA large subunit methyltransferase L n=1 Tax=mine drainage metagenome TaxID=410659 RepID=A0A1J5QWG1_9ZZZZ
MSDTGFEIFLVTAPGLEPALLAEARDQGFAAARAVTGGVVVEGGWPEVWRANLRLRCASKVLARIGAFRALHLAQLDKRARKLDWAAVLRPDLPVRVEAACKASRIYHAGAAAQRVATALHESLGAPLSDEAEICVKVRIDDDLCTVSVDSSGEPLHKRKHKEAVNKAPMRETMAAAFLRLCGYSGTEPVLDPMCGSGTFVIEAAEIAAGLAPGRSRAFAFELLAGFDPQAWDALRAAAPGAPPPLLFYGSDRDPGAVGMSHANAVRAGVGGITRFTPQALAACQPPPGPPGLVIVNPPYGERLGDRKSLMPLYRQLGEVMRSRFSGWRLGLITSDATLARACALPFAAPIGPVAHGGLRVSLFLTPPLA